MRGRVFLPLLVLFVLGSASGVTGTAHAAQPAPAPAPTITGRAFPVPDGARYCAVACAGAGTCIAAGQSKVTGGDGVLTPISAGSLGSPTPVGGTSSLVGIACPTAAMCVAIGQGAGLALTTAVVLPIKDGRPGKAEQFPGMFLFGIACGSLASCWATGETAHLRHALLAHIVDGRVVHVFTLQGVAAVSFSPPYDIDPSVFPDPGSPPDCYSASECSVGTSTGNWQDQGTGLVVWLQSGRVTGVLHVPGTSRIVGLDCVSAGNCTALADNSHASLEGSVITISRGRRSHVTTTVPVASGVRSDFPALSSMACDATACFGVGPINLILEIVGGQPVVDVQTHWFLSAVACGTAVCAGVGGTDHGDGSVDIVYAFR